MFHLGLCVTVLMSACSVVQSAVFPDGVLQMECHERYFMIAVDLSFTGEELRFEAVDESGVYPVTEQYGAQNGYTVRVLPLQGLVELRASYFSRHAENKDDEMFTFRFNLVVGRDDEEVSYALSETCSPSLPWSPREVTCEANYMEVSVRREMTCSPGTKKDDWNALKKAHSSTTSDWQVVFQQGEEKHSPISISEASALGYAFLPTDGRLVFRAPHGQPHSLTTEVNGVPVEEVSVTIYSRQSWMVLMVDLVAACSMDEGSAEGAHMVWQTPDVLDPSLGVVRVSVGLNGELLEQPAAERKGYTFRNIHAKFQIGVPFDADGRHRKSFVNDSLLEFYVFHFYFEQILVDGDQVETRQRLSRTMTAVVPCPIFTENRTVVEERLFTAYLGDVPEDVALAAVRLNGEEFSLAFANATEVGYANNTHGYTLKVPFDHPAVVKKLMKEEDLLLHVLHIQFVLVVMPENATYSHRAAITAAVPHLPPPDVASSCLGSGIRFTLERRPSRPPWKVAVGSAVLTPELATQRGYVLSNRSRSLQLDVPLFTPGYKYQNVSLGGFSGTFGISVQHPEVSDVHRSFTRTCPFSLSEYILCSHDRTLTVTVDSSTVVKGVVDPAAAHLLDQTCKPKAWGGARAQFSFSLNSCGTRVEVHGNSATYENEIFFTQLGGASGRRRLAVLVVRCSYPGTSLNQLSSTSPFDADGVGTIVRTEQKELTTVPPPARATPHLAYVGPHQREREPAESRGFLAQIRGEFDQMYSKIRRWISENCL